jgi:hypothetical protein
LPLFAIMRQDAAAALFATNLGYRIHGYNTLAREVFSTVGAGGNGGLSGSGLTAGFGVGSAGISLVAGVGVPQELAHRLP